MDKMKMIQGQLVLVTKDDLYKKSIIYTCHSFVANSPCPSASNQSNSNYKHDSHKDKLKEQTLFHSMEIVQYKSSLGTKLRLL